MGKTPKNKTEKSKTINPLKDIPEPDAVPVEQENTVEEPEQSVEEVEAEVVEEQVPHEFKQATPGGRRMTREEAEAFMQKCGLGVFIPAEQFVPQLPPNFPQAQMFTQTTQPSAFTAAFNAAFTNAFNNAQGNTTMGNKPTSDISILPDNFFQTSKPKKKMTKKEEDEFFKDSFFWNPGEEWQTIGLIAGGCAAVGLGALLYHLLKK